MAVCVINLLSNNIYLNLLAHEAFFSVPLFISSYECRILLIHTLHIKAAISKKKTLGKSL